MVLGIDFGLRNIGIALSNEEGTVAAAYKTLAIKDLIANLNKIITEKNIKKVVVGYPTKGNGEEGFVAKMLNTMLEELKKEFPSIEIIYIDESMTTQIALNNLRQQGYSHKSIETMKDAEAARIILQTYLDQVK